MDRSFYWICLFVALVLALALNASRAVAAPTWETMRPLQNMLNDATMSASSTGKITGLPGGQAKYSTVSAPVSLPAVRDQATKALKRGRVHPALFAASVAGGLLLDGDTGEILEEQEVENTIDPDDYPPAGYAYWGSSACRAPDPLTGAECDYQEDGYTAISVVGDHAIDDWVTVEMARSDGSTFTTGVPFNTCSSGDDCHNWDPDEYSSDTTRYVPVPESDWPSVLDPHIEPVQDELADEISNDPESDWSQDMPPEIQSEQGMPPSLRERIQKEMQNAEAQENGEELPNPETETNTQDAEDQIVDELTDAPTNLPDDPDPEWEVNEYGPDDMTPQDVNIGTDQCPAPYQIDLVGDLPTVEITFDYICDFAEFVHWFFVAGAWILAGTIVIRE